MDLLVPFFAYLVFGLLAIFLCTYRVVRSERRAISQLLLTGFALRMAAATMFEVFPSTRMFHEDADGYQWVGGMLAHMWWGSGPPIAIPHVQNQGYFYLAGIADYIVGGFSAGAPFLNCVFGTLTIFFVYRLARRFFHVLVARRAAALCAYIPSLILWSAVAAKDTVMTLLVVVCLSYCVELKRNFSPINLLFTVLPIAACQPIRFYMVYFLSFSVVVSLFLERGGKLVTAMPKQLLIIAGGVALLILVGVFGSAQAGLEEATLERVSQFRAGMAATANSGFAHDVDVSTPGGALLFMPYGITMLLFAPFPWQLTSMRAAFALPEMLVWWSMVPALWKGLKFVLRYRLTTCSPILIFAVTLTCVYSLMHGNIGSGFRQRAQIFVFLFIFASLGSYLKRAEKTGVDQGELLEAVS
jgi:hypothetical protein